MTNFLIGLFGVTIILAVGWLSYRLQKRTLGIDELTRRIEKLEAMMNAVTLERGIKSLR